jgi:hypothetical protein
VPNRCSAKSPCAGVTGQAAFHGGFDLATREAARKASGHITDDIEAYLPFPPPIKNASLTAGQVAGVGVKAAASVAREETARAKLACASGSRGRRRRKR